MIVFEGEYYMHVSTLKYTCPYAEILFKGVHTYTQKVKFDRITRMINEVNLQVFLRNSHSIITTFPLCRAACLDSRLNLQVQFERQLISASNL